MRLFLLPISTRRSLIYCQRATQKATTDLTYVERATKKAADTWAAWEGAEKGWKKMLTKYGNQGLQRIPYEEWGLKSFPPLSQTAQADDMAMMADGEKFEVHYPRNIIKQEEVPLILARLAKERKQLHWTRFMGCLIGMPFMAPFALVPVIPNIPFFYLAFRCWSHWRALKGSDHLDFMLDHRILRFVSTPKIESIYKTVAPNLQNSYHFVTRNQVLDGEDPREELLLTTDSHSMVSKTLHVPELSGEIERAVKQVTTSMKKQEEEQQREKAATVREKTAVPASSETEDKMKP
jgi:hypothetical protein